MKKLFLTHISFTTGTVEHNMYRIVCVNSNGSSESEEKDQTKATDLVKNWFPKNYPESTLHSIIPLSAINEDSTEQDDRLEFYSRARLVSFGEYLFSEERTKRITDAHEKGDIIPLGARLRQVYHADVENWKAKIEDIA